MTNVVVKMLDAAGAPVDGIQIGGCLHVIDSVPDAMIKQEIARLQSNRENPQELIARCEREIVLQRAHQIILEAKIAEHEAVITNKKQEIASLQNSMQPNNQIITALGVVLEQRKANGSLRKFEPEKPARLKTKK